ncbi:hypothetical protein [Novosphingobium panipatense]
MSHPRAQGVTRGDGEAHVGAAMARAVAEGHCVEIKREIVRDGK